MYNLAHLGNLKADISEVCVVSIEHDMTVEQRKERTEMVDSAKEEQRKQPECSQFQICVRGPTDAMRIVRSTGKWETLEKK